MLIAIIVPLSHDDKPYKNVRSIAIEGTDEGKEEKNLNFVKIPPQNTKYLNHVLAEIDLFVGAKNFRSKG